MSIPQTVANIVEATGAADDGDADFLALTAAFTECWQAFDDADAARKRGDRAEAERLRAVSKSLAEKHRALSEAYRLELRGGTLN